MSWIAAAIFGAALIALTLSLIGNDVSLRVRAGSHVDHPFKADDSKHDFLKAIGYEGLRVSGTFNYPDVMNLGDATLVAADFYLEGSRNTKKLAWFFDSPRPSLCKLIAPDARPEIENLVYAGIGRSPRTLHCSWTVMPPRAGNQILLFKAVFLSKYATTPMRLRPSNDVQQFTILKDGVMNVYDPLFTFAHFAVLATAIVSLLVGFVPVVMAMIPVTKSHKKSEKLRN